MTTLEDIFNPLDRNAWKYADEDENLTVYPSKYVVVVIIEFLKLKQNILNHLINH